MVPESGGMLGDVLLGGLGIGGILWAVYEKFTRQKLESANIDSGVAVSNANEALFNMLTQRMSSLEEEVKRLKSDLEKERDYTHLLVNVMVGAGLQPPPYPSRST